MEKTLVWRFKMELKCVWLCIVVTWLARPYRRETNLRYSFSFSLCSSQTQKNGGNSVTLATNSAYVQREAADGGGRREEERETNTSAYCTNTYIELSRRITQPSSSGVSSLLYTSQNYSSTHISLIPPLFSPSFLFCFPTSPFPSLVRLLAFLPHALWPRMRTVQTQPVSSGIPWEHYSAFLLLYFLSIPSFCPSPIYLQLMCVLLLIVLQRIWMGFVSALPGFI